MPVKVYKPTSPGRRDQTGHSFDEITRSHPEDALTRPLRRKGGRNSAGKMTVRHRGGGHKRRYRSIDFKRDKVGVPAKVVSIEYDPNRSARIALLHYVDGEKRYILAPLGLKVGDVLKSDLNADIKPGNCLPLSRIPLGTLIHNIELQKGKGGQIVRSAGTGARLIAKEGEYAQIRMPSGEVRLIRLECKATVGEVGNADHQNVKLGKAGRKRHRGIRPTVRGSAMSPRDHPHGGGEGRQGIGMPGPKTPWGKPARGVKTRRNKRSGKFILRGRGKKRRG